VVQFPTGGREIENFVEMQVGLGILKGGFMANAWRKAKAVSQRQALAALNKLPQWLLTKERILKIYCWVAAAVSEGMMFNLAPLGREHRVYGC
jgi:hypothetical protein